MHLQEEDMENIIKEYYTDLLQENSFIPIDGTSIYGPLGTTWALSDKIGKGTYWMYAQKGLYDIKIHDFYFYQDTIIDIKTPECLSISYYESLAGEELSPYKHIKANHVKSFIGGYTPYKANIHKLIPVKSIGIEILPAYYEEYLKTHYAGEYEHPFDAFADIDETDDFPEMVHLLSKVKRYRGEGISASLFYDAMVAEAVSLVIKRSQQKKSTNKIVLAQKDIELMVSLTAYINEHYAFDLKLEQLCKIACMGTTKLKKTFKAYHGYTITEYIQNRRISQAEHLLSYTDLNIRQVANAVGYKSSSRFSDLFRKNTGILPNEFKKMCQESDS